MDLPFGSGVGGAAVAVDASFVADAYRVGVVASGVGADAFQFAGRFDVTVFADVEVVAGAVEAAAAVTHFEVVFGEIPVRP